MLHERKYQQCHEDFIKCCLKLIPSLRNCRFPIVTDEEKGIVNGISNLLPFTPHLCCWNHVFRDIKHGCENMEHLVRILLYARMMYGNWFIQYQKLHTQICCCKWKINGVHLSSTIIEHAFIQISIPLLVGQLRIMTLSVALRIINQSHWILSSSTSKNDTKLQ